MVKYASKESLYSRRHIEFTGETMPKAMEESVEEDDPNLVVVVYNSKFGWHIIGVAMDNKGNCGIFDPNVGLALIETSMGLIKVGRFQAIVKELVKSYQIDTGRCHELMKL